MKGLSAREVAVLLDDLKRGALGHRSVLQLTGAQCKYLAVAVRAYEILKHDAPLYDPESEYCRLHDVLNEAERV